MIVQNMAYDQQVGTFNASPLHVEIFTRAEMPAPPTTAHAYRGLARQAQPADTFIYVPWLPAFML